MGNSCFLLVIATQLCQGYLYYCRVTVQQCMGLTYEVFPMCPGGRSEAGGTEPVVIDDASDNKAGVPRHAYANVGELSSAEAICITALSRSSNKSLRWTPGARTWMGLCWMVTKQQTLQAPTCHCPVRTHVHRPSTSRPTQPPPSKRTSSAWQFRRLQQDSSLPDSGRGLEMELCIL